MQLANQKKITSIFSQCKEASIIIFRSTFHVAMKSRISANIYSQNRYKLEWLIISGKWSSDMHASFPMMVAPMLSGENVGFNSKVIL